ncbi:hypothetical protein BKA65DRAFT_432927 [Rhexocercosporidium sp. MPI-PUGE-AT-0058]|nr:hypothetical protein BKA65DRAFT_432927 [Rhexocercosporidium sp. MPI-PUGE-AT-0058]
MAPSTPLNVITPDRPMVIVIVGGSNTGLMIGIVLKRLGHTVYIMEQSGQSERSDLAAGITTHPEFDEFMALHDDVEGEWCLKSSGLQFLDKAGAVTREVNRPLKMTSWGVIYHRLRANFDGLASSFCPNPPAARETDGTATLLLGCRIDQMTDTGLAIKVPFVEEPGKGGTILGADMVILADGANSTLRSQIFPEVERVYAGYVAFRGTVLEADLSEETKNTFLKLTYFCFKDNYILLYIIPGADGSLEVGHRRYNWVWYHPIAANSPDFTEMMTDTSGNVHRNTLPAGSMNLNAWAKYKSMASSDMCAAFAEVVDKTTQPFVTAISDLACPRAIAMGGRMLITGECLNLVRPHMALSTTASAKQALLLEKVFRGQISIEQWEKQVLYEGKIDKLKTNALGMYLLYGTFSAVGWAAKLVAAMIGGILPFSSSSLPPIPAVKQLGHI